MRLHARILTSALVLCAGLVTGCAATVNIEAAEFANSPNCANLIVRLPQSVAGLDQRTVNAQASAAYGNPVAVIIRCGLPTPPPSPLPCYTIDQVDWLRDDSDSPNFVFTTYGLDPATEVIVDSAAVSGTQVLQEISRAVGTQSAPFARCLDPVDALN